MFLVTKHITNALTLITVFLCFGLNISSAQDVETRLSANADKLNVGEVVIVNLSVEPDAGNPVYTVSANLVYDPSKLEFISATVDSQWLELNQKELFVTDTINGLIIRTGGYPNGFLGAAKFVSYKFKARSLGDTRILIAAGKAYNDNNSDVGVKTTDLNLTILGSSEEGGEAKEARKEKVFDLRIAIKSDNAFYRQDTYTFTMYHKKEEKHQQAITKIWLFDENWNVHFEDERLWRTDQDTVLNFTIPGDTVGKEGNFKIIAKVRYEDDREFEVAEKDIGILSNGKTWFTKNSQLFMPLFFVLIIIAAIHHVFVEREVYFKLHSLLRAKRSLVPKKMGKTKRVK
jgi:hypothetical protein